MSTMLINTAHALESMTKHLDTKVTFQGEKLTATFTAISLRQIMEEISEVSGVQIRWLDTEGEELMTVDFVAMPLSRVIPQLLRDRNFVLFYSSTGPGTRLTQIWISSRKAGGKQSESIQPPISRALPPSISRDNNVIQEDVVSSDTLLQTLLYDRGISTRLDAITRLIAYAPQDPRIAAAFSHLASNETNPEVQHAAATALQQLEEE